MSDRSGRHCKQFELRSNTRAAAALVTRVLSFGSISVKLFDVPLIYFVLPLDQTEHLSWYLCPLRLAGPRKFSKLVRIWLVQPHRWIPVETERKIPRTRPTEAEDESTKAPSVSTLSRQSFSPPSPWIKLSISCYGSCRRRLILAEILSGTDEWRRKWPQHFQDSQHPMDLTVVMYWLPPPITPSMCKGLRFWSKADGRHFMLALERGSPTRCLRAPGRPQEPH